jgi:hypothetical protein
MKCYDFNVPIVGIIFVSIVMLLFMNHYIIVPVVFVDPNDDNYFLKKINLIVQNQGVIQNNSQQKRERRSTIFSF